MRKKWIGLLLLLCAAGIPNRADMAGIEQEEERREQLEHMIDAIDQEENLREPIIKEEDNIDESLPGGGQNSFRYRRPKGCHLPPPRD